MEDFFVKFSLFRERFPLIVWKFIGQEIPNIADSEKAFPQKFPQCRKCFCMFGFMNNGAGSFYGIIVSHGDTDYNPRWCSIRTMAAGSRAVNAAGRFYRNPDV